MSLPVPGAYIFKSFLLTLDSVDVASQVSSCKLVPSQDVKTLKTGTPGGVAQDVGDPTWVLQVTGVQNNTASTGLAAILRAAAVAGDTIAVVWVPNKTSGEPKATFDISPVYMEFGGEVDAWNTSDLSLPVVGVPTWGTYSA